MRYAKTFFITAVISFILILPLAYSQEKKDFDYSGYNVLFVSFDALQAAHTGCLGYFRNTTPLIDEFARKGFLFTQAISQANWTVPSTMSWFTSLYPSEHKVVNKYSQYTEEKKVLTNLSELSPGVVTLAEILKENSYATAGFTGDAGVSLKFGFGKGFDVYIDDRKFAGLDYSAPPAIEWLKENKDKKFFMFLHGYDQHGQYDPPKGFTRRFVDFDYKGPLKGGKEEQGVFREEGLEKGSIELTEEDVRFWRALYDEKIYDANQRMEKFIEEFEKLGLLDKTIIILTSDHGTEFYEHKRFDHGFSLYDELIRVPLVIYLPGKKGEEVIRKQVRGIDLMPTIIDLLRINVNDKIKNQIRGVSLVPLMKRESMDLTAYSETDYRLYVHLRSIRTPDGWKFIYNLTSDGKELYNLNKDPGELENLVRKEPVKAYELEQELFKWLISMKSSPVYYRNKEELKIREY